MRQNVAKGTHLMKKERRRMMKHLIDIKDLSVEEIDDLIETA